MIPGIGTPISLAASIVLGGLTIVALALTGWGWATFLSLAMAVVGLVAFFGSSTARLGIFFSLLAIGEFAKKAVFLLPGQQAWSPYLVFLTPYAYFLVAILIPWLLAGTVFAKDALSLSIWAFVALSTAFTWLSPQFPFEAKSAATLFIIVPWLTVLVARDDPRAIDAACRTLAYCGAASAAVGIIQFFVGPTPVDLAWAANAEDISIGATHLAATLEDSSGVFYIWRPTGMQPDGFTYAMFLMTAFAALWTARLRQSVSQIVFVVLSGVLVIGIAVSLVRGIWLSFAVLVAYAFAARLAPALLRPGIIMTLLAAALIASQVVGQYLYDSYSWYAGTIRGAVVARVLTTGTIEARLGVFSAIEEAITRYGAFGMGYGGHAWIAHKFAPPGGLPDTLNVHNVVTELLVLVGVPGLLLFILVLYAVFRGAWRIHPETGGTAARVRTVITGYLVAMIVSGFTNGSVFLGYHFFFFAGALHALFAPYRGGEKTH